MQPFKVLIIWFPIAVIVTLIYLAIYGATQQVVRQSANDPQIQLAEDTVTVLTKGMTAKSVVPTESIDMAQSLAPFTIVYNQKGDITASSATVNGEAPVLPAGVLAYAQNHGEDRLTWEPKTDIRSAIVVLPYSDGFVLVGRSLREVEKRELLLVNRVGFAWGLSLLVLLFCPPVLAQLLTKKR